MYHCTLYQLNDRDSLLSLWKSLPGGPTAPIEGAHSDLARSGSSGPHWFSRYTFFLLGVAWLNPQLRASNEGLPRPRVALAQEASKLLHSYSGNFPSVHSFKWVGWEGP